jgi:hypothetical protein
MFFMNFAPEGELFACFDCFVRAYLGLQKGFRELFISFSTMPMNGKKQPQTMLKFLNETIDY